MASDGVGEIDRKPMPPAQGLSSDVAKNDSGKAWVGQT